MEINTRKAYSYFIKGNKKVWYTEVVVTEFGKKVSIRKYPKNTLVRYINNLPKSDHLLQIRAENGNLTFGELKVFFKILDISLSLEWYNAIIRELSTNSEFVTWKF